MLSSMEHDFRRKYGIISADSSSPGGNVSPRALRYESAKLKQVGEQCGNRLPPASAVQAMFLYEMQRETESEKLFHHQFLRLARNEDASVDLARRIDALETRLAQMERQDARRAVEGRLTTSRVALNIQQGKLNICSGRVDSLEQKLAGLQSQLQTLQESADAIEAVAIATATTQHDVDLLCTVKEELDVLFDDRDGILSMMYEVKDRVNKLEDNVRALTLQGTSIKSPRSSSPQILPMQTANGQTMDLAVPKGSAHVTLKDIGRSYSSGKQ